MVIVDENRLKGNYGATFVAQMLSQRCLVRPVAEGTDIGVDLYCESVTDDGKPFQHFWVQVKTGAQVVIAPDRITARCRFDGKNLEYWERQPVPVFSLLVPMPTWPPVPPERIYIVDLTEYVLLNPPPYPNSLTLQSRADGTCIFPDRLDSVKGFLYSHIPYFTAARKIRDGIVDVIENPVGPAYTNYIPSGFASRFAPQIVGAIRRTVIWSSMEFLRTNNPQLAEVNQLLLSILRVYINAGYSYYEQDVVLGLEALRQGQLDQARVYRQTALDKIAGDSGLTEADRAPMRRLVEECLSA